MNDNQFQLDIIVFPEKGLTGNNVSFFIPVPDPTKKVSPWNDTSQNKVILLINSHKMLQPFLVIFLIVL